MNVFLFQSVPGRYDLRQELVPGKRETWLATRYRSEMCPGDAVFFWMAGDEDERGVYGWGELASEPRREDRWDSYGVDVIYRVKFERPLLATRIRAQPKLRDLLILRAPQATNFLLDNEEIKALFHLIEEMGQRVPALRAAA